MPFLTWRGVPSSPMVQPQGRKPNMAAPNTVKIINDISGNTPPAV
jgi:hypothetical protein